MVSLELRDEFMSITDMRVQQYPRLSGLIDIQE
jgi:hypothetical protein